MYERMWLFFQRVSKEKCLGTKSFLRQEVCAFRKAQFVGTNTIMKQLKIDFHELKQRTCRVCRGASAMVETEMTANPCSFHSDLHVVFVLYIVDIIARCGRSWILASQPRSLASWFALKWGDFVLRCRIDDVVCLLDEGWFRDFLHEKSDGWHQCWVMCKVRVNLIYMRYRSIFDQ